MGSDWRNDLETWLTPFVASLGHKTRGRMCPSYVAGLIGPGDRKSVRPLAARDDAVSYPLMSCKVETRAQRSTVACDPSTRSG